MSWAVPDEIRDYYQAATRPGICAEIADRAGFRGEFVQAGQRCAYLLGRHDSFPDDRFLESAA
jgi:hypothetical protein